MNNADAAIWEKYRLMIEEASEYFNIGENELHNFIRQFKAMTNA